MQAKKSSSFDKISNAMLKKVPAMVIPVTKVINKSLTQAHVPAKFKIAELIPLHKSGSKKSFNNYRPISLLSVLSKLLEKAAYEQIYNYFEEHFLTNVQFGFRKGHETQHCIANFLNNIYSNKNKQYHGAVFIDLRKAFDTVPHNILLEKLNYYGFDCNALGWISDYLSGRFQATDIEGNISNLLEISVGVPQGSILGPLLFLIFINDLPGSLKLFTSLFADDTTFQYSSNTLQELSNAMNRELEIASQWFADNRLSIHPNKTTCMLFTKGNTKKLDMNISIMNTKIEQVGTGRMNETTKFLGMIVDDKLTWEPHINKVASKLRSINFYLAQVKHILPEKLKVNLYNALFKPHIEYCLNIYGHANISKLTKIQKRAIRLTFNSKYNAHAEPLFKKAKTLKIKDLYKLNALTFMRKIADQQAPIVINDMYTYFVEKNRKYHVFGEDMPSTSFFNQFPNHSFPKLWNIEMNSNNPPEFKSLVKSFKLQIKNQILDSYYEKCTLKKCYVCQTN